MTMLFDRNDLRTIKRQRRQLDRDRAKLSCIFLDAGKRRHKAQQQQAGYTQGNNDQAQAAVLALAQPMIQQVFQTSFAASNSALGQILNIQLNNVGLNTKLTAEVSGQIAAAAGETLTKTQWGLSNFFSNIQLIDLSNYTRVNTAGWHLTALASLRRQAAFGAAFVNDSPVNMGSNFRVNFQPNPIIGAVAQNFKFFFEIPIAYHDYDLRGAIYAAVTSATWRVQLTINPSIVAPSTATDTTLACYQSNSAVNLGTITNVTIQIYQHYLDQLPVSGGTAVVPLMSLAWNYLIQNTTQTAIVQGQDFPTQYANFRTFLSTIFIYDNAGQLNPGTDVNYIGIQAANLVFLQKLDPFMNSLLTRGILGDDYPPGTYAFDHRRKPIQTHQFGNTQLVFNASVVNAGAALLIGYEMLAIQSQAINAGSLAGN
jgi:hypothetical protein